jgi:uncharacterized protein with GYD domain
MPLYMYQAAYTPESLAAQIKEPKDRIEAIRASVESAGASIVVGGYSMGEYDAMAVYEAPDDVSAAAIALAFGAGGALKAAKTTKLLTSAEYVQALQKAQGVTSQYRPAR